MELGRPPLLKDMLDGELEKIDFVLDQAEACSQSPSKQPAWRLRQTMLEQSRIIRQLLHGMPVD